MFVVNENKPQSRLEAKLEQGRGVETELGMVRRCLYIQAEMLINLHLCSVFLAWV